MLKLTQNSSSHKVAELFFPVDITSYLTVLFYLSEIAVSGVKRYKLPGYRTTQAHKSRHCRVAAWPMIPFDPRTHKYLSERGPADQAHQRDRCPGGGPLRLLWHCREWHWALRPLLWYLPILGDFCLTPDSHADSVPWLLSLTLVILLLNRSPWYLTASS